MTIADVEKGRTYYYARIATDEIIEVKIRSIYDNCAVGCYKGYAYVVYAKSIPDLLYLNRKDALKYLKEHKIVYKIEEEENEDEY